MQTPAEKDMLLVLWRLAACAAVRLLSLFCSEACSQHIKYKNNKQVLGQMTMSLFLHMSQESLVSVTVQA